MPYECTLCGGVARLKSKQDHAGMVSIIVRCEADGCPGHGVRFYVEDNTDATEVMRGTIKK